MRFLILEEYNEDGQEWHVILEDGEGDIVNAMMKFDEFRERYPKIKVRLYKEVTSEDY